MVKTLGGFHHRVARRITGKIPWRKANRIWYFPPLADATRVVRMEELEN